MSYTSDDALRRKRYHAKRSASAAFMQITLACCNYFEMLLTMMTNRKMTMKPRRDTRARNLVFLITVISALVVGLWLAR